MSNKTFPTLGAYRNWMSLADGEEVLFPLGDNSRGWMVVVHDEEVEIISGFFTVKPSSPYGAPKICGICFPYGEHQCSGVIEFGMKDGKFVVINRRRLTGKDQLEIDKTVVCIINAQPDRVDEPVAVVISDGDQTMITNFTVEQWLNLFNSVRDALELLAVRELRKVFAVSLK